ncbi:hypothetical protein JCM10449v2_000300 [Rhodotorula kratochvilovae]
MLPAQPILSPTMDPLDISPLSLPASPPSPTISELSLDALACSDDDDAASSVADTADSCCSTCCAPTADEVKPAAPSPSIDGPPTAATVTVDESAFSPLVIIGAGPHALALAARLAEPRPAALYSDLEHARLSWLQREQRTAPSSSSLGTSGRKAKEHRLPVKGHWSARRLVPPATATLAHPVVGSDDADDEVPPAGPAIQVLDSSSSEWMARWDGFFAGLRIEHLRSPMLFHPAPADANALVAYARRTGREDELEPIKGVVGAELSKYQRKKNPSRVGRAVMINEREREDYHRPSSTLFRSFIRDDLISRYRTAPLVEHTTVTSVAYETVHVAGRAPETAFVVRSTRHDGAEEVRVARAVVMAVGPSSAPNVPCVIRDALPPPATEAEAGTAPWRKEDICGRGWCHSAAFALPRCRPMDGELGERVRQGLPTRVVVIGGGLTSAQIVDSLLSAGVTSVTLLSRSHIKTKHFDFDLSWVSKYANVDKMAFYRESDPRERFEQIRTARNGGSVNPHFLSVLKRHAKTGRLDLRVLSEVRRAEYDEGSGKWSLSVRTRREEKRRVLGDEEWDEHALEDVDFVVCSTGSTLDLEKVPLVQPLLRSHPVELVQGLPRLTMDLQWTEEVPFFVMGAYAMLELGPDALNLSGTRTGAERIAHRLGALGIFDDVPGGGMQSIPRNEGKSERERRKEWRSGGEGNYFEGLGEVAA